MRILNICETAHGGVGIYQGYLAELSGDGVEMHYLVPAQDAAFLGSGLTLHTFDRPKRGVRAVAAMRREFRRVLDRVDPDLCFFHSSFALAALADLRWRGDRRPALYCPHGWAVLGYPENTMKSAVVRTVEGCLSGLAARVVCVSENERAVAERHRYAGRFTVIENAVPKPRSDARDDAFSAEPDALHLLFVGRQDYQKGFDVLAKALVAAGRDDLRLHVIGGSVRGDGAPVEVPPHTNMIGWVGQEEIDSWYRSADALIVPSRWEGLPLVIPEAFRNGTPVICSERSDMEKLVNRMHTGDHFPLEVSALTKVLKGLDKQALREMRPACKAAYETRFTTARMLTELKTLLDDVTR